MKCPFVFVFCSAKMPRKERIKKQKMKELREAAKGSGSLSSWFMKSTTGKNNTCSLSFVLQRCSILDNNYYNNSNNNINCYIPVYQLFNVLFCINI